MKHRLITISLLILFFNFSYSQNIVDSLTIELKNCKKDTAKISVLNELVMSIYNTNPELAFEYATLAYSITQEENYKIHYTETLNAIAVANWALGKFDKSLEYLFEKLKIHQQKNDLRNIAATYRNIAIIYNETERTELSLKYLFKALEINKQGNYEIGVAEVSNLLGVTYNKIDSISKAKKYWLIALELYTKNNQTLRVAYVKNNLGSILEKHNQLDSALIYYNESLEICNKFNDNWSVSNILKSIAEVYVKKNNILLANNYYKKAIDTARKYKLTQQEINILFSIAQLDTIKKDYKSAFEHYTQYISLKDSIFSEKQDKTISELEIKYETEKKEQENILLKKSEKINFLIATATGIILILTIIFLIFLWRLIRIKQKANTILNKQNNEILKQNILINEQKNEIEDAHKNIMDGINYAKTIQDALLTRKNLIDSYINNYFIFNMPLQQVSGDFYYINKIEKHLIIAIADCTGHGVPGGFLTMLGITYLNEILRREETDNPGKALNMLRERFKKTFIEIGTNNNNGLDIALCAINTETNILQYAGAYNPLVIIRNEKLTEYKATRNPIGFYEKEKPFKNNEIQLQNNDMIYLFSDGFQDQLGGKENKKFRSNKFKELLLSIHNLPMKTQDNILNKVFMKWKGNNDQTDDILIFGMKYNK